MSMEKPDQFRTIRFDLSTKIALCASLLFEGDARAAVSAATEIVEHSDTQARRLRNEQPNNHSNNRSEKAVS